VVSGTVVPLREEPRVQLLNPDADHQARTAVSPGGFLSLSCACRERESLPPLGSRKCWDPEDVLAVYRKHLADEGALG